MAEKPQNQNVDFAYSQVEAWCLIGEEKLRVPIISFELNYVLNSIPVGILTFATGREIPSKKVAEIHSLNSRIGFSTPVEVWVRLTPKRDNRRSELVLEEGEMRVFNGYCAGGIGTAVEYGAYSLRMGIVGKLIDLHSGSIVSSSLYANIPDNMLRQTFANIYSREQALVTIPSSFGEEVVVDLWKAIENLLRKVAEGMGAVPPGFARFAKSNLNVLKGLDLFKDSTLKFRLEGGGAPLVSVAITQRIADFLVNQIFSALNGQTAWDKIVYAAATTLFAISPTVEAAYAVPHTPVHLEIWKSIYAEEYFSGRLETYSPRLMSGLLLVELGIGARMWNAESEAPAGMDSVVGVSHSELKVVQNEIPGVVFFRIAPPWFLGEAGISLLTQPTSVNLNTALNPGAVDGAAQQKVANTQFPENSSNLFGLGDVLAQMMYVDEKYRLRTGWITGRWRTDIAPGSSVNVEMLNLASESGRQWSVGNVVGVRLAMSKTPPSVTTSLQLTHLRTGTEIGEAVPQNLMYADSWYGAPLIERPAE